MANLLKQVTKQLNANSGKMLFCPLCAMMLLVDSDTGSYRFYCQTCPYIYDIEHRFVREVALSSKMIDDIMTMDQWKNVDKEKVECPRCGYGEAYCRMSQTRSADEPMTIFYRCANPVGLTPTDGPCNYNWRGD